MANIRIDYIRNKTDYIAITTTMYKDNCHGILLYGYVFKMNFSGYLEYLHGEYFSIDYLTSLYNVKGQKYELQNEKEIYGLHKGMIVTDDDDMYIDYSEVEFDEI